MNLGNKLKKNKQQQAKDFLELFTVMREQEFIRNGVVWRKAEHFFESEKQRIGEEINLGKLPKSIILPDYFKAYDYWNGHRVTNFRGSTYLFDTSEYIELGEVTSHPLHEIIQSFFDWGTTENLFLNFIFNQKEKEYYLKID